MREEMLLLTWAKFRQIRDRRLNWLFSICQTNHKKKKKARERNWVLFFLLSFVFLSQCWVECFSNNRQVSFEWIHRRTSLPTFFHPFSIRVTINISAIWTTWPSPTRKCSKTSSKSVQGNLRLARHRPPLLLRHPLSHRWLSPPMIRLSSRNARTHSSTQIITKSRIERISQRNARKSPTTKMRIRRTNDRENNRSLNKCWKKRIQPTKNNRKHRSRTLIRRPTTKSKRWAKSSVNLRNKYVATSDLCLIPSRCLSRIAQSIFKYQCYRSAQLRIYHFCRTSKTWHAPITSRLLCRWLAFWKIFRRNSSLRYTQPRSKLNASLFHHHHHLPTRRQFTTIIIHISLRFCSTTLLSIIILQPHHYHRLPCCASVASRPIARILFT